MSRAFVILVTGFWLTMNVLLWQTEFGSRQTGGAVSADVVWEKILTAADDSSLTVLHAGKLVGTCHWQTQSSEDWAQVTDDSLPSGRPKKARGYRLSVDGNAVLPSLTNRLRFDGELKLNQSREWQEVNARFSTREVSGEMHANAAAQNLRLSLKGGSTPLEVTLGFADLRNPAALALKLLGPSAGDLASEAGMAVVASRASSVALGVKWDAHEDVIRVGRTAVQVYRLNTRIMDRYDLSMIVSRAGEILRVDLPGDYRLVNDRLAINPERPARKS